MKTITRAQAMRLIRSLAGSVFTCRTTRGNSGDYSRRETYSANGTPFLMLCLSYNPPACRAYSLKSQ